MSRHEWQNVPAYRRMTVSGGALWPSFGSVYEYLFNRSADLKKAHVGSLSWQGPEEFGTAQNTGTWCPACSLLSGNIDDCLGLFNVILSIMHWTDMLIIGFCSFSWSSSPKILWELMLLRFLPWGWQLTLQNLEIFFTARFSQCYKSLTVKGIPLEWKMISVAMPSQFL